MTYQRQVPHGLPAPGTAQARRVERLFRAGQRLFHQGDAADHVFELREGMMRQSHLLASGERQVIGFHFPGDIIGFSADGLHYADCTAITDGSAVIHRAEAFAFPARDAVLQHRLLSAAVREIAARQEQLIMRGRKSASEKVEMFLQYLARRSGAGDRATAVLDIPMSRNDIADFLGLAVETVSRAFSELRNAGIIEMDDPRRVTLVRPLLVSGLR